jgi:predicted transcriptional regulator
VTGHNKKKPGFVSARITDEEANAVNNLTKQRRESVSAFVRRAISEQVRRETRELADA